MTGPALEGIQYGDPLPGKPNMAFLAFCHAGMKVITVPMQAFRDSDPFARRATALDIAKLVE